MGCVTSKQAVTVTPAFDHSGGLRDNAEVGSGRSRVESSGSGLGLELDLRKVKKRGNESGVSGGSQLGESGRTSSKGVGSESVSFRLGNLQKYVEGEQVAAGWPSWLSAVAGEAIYGWIPLRAESFEKLEKIGQGTYSSVFRARDLETGKIVALKKVRFDNFEPESVRFMAREIMILRRLDHPNIVKLEGVITSRLSCSMYLVFEYMEHDIAGLLSCPEAKFSEAQIKCYMKQLLSGIEHCHSMGVMHRDIKGANLLVNDNGMLKIADFGLANFCNYGHNKQPLTSRVVTLWYRPPELLLGSTDYGTSVDLWSVGCVFSELLIGKPVLQGRTEVEQLHKIFKLCGTPPNDYWKKSKLPHATLFKPQNPYSSSLMETFKDLPKAAVFLIETLLSVEPYKRGTASAALDSEYFKTKPYACDPSSLPKYPPSKEIDAKQREEAINVKKRQSGRPHGPDTARKLTRKQNGVVKMGPEENLPPPAQALYKSSRLCSSKHKEDGVLNIEPSKPSVEIKEEASSHVKNASHGDVPFSGPLQVSGSSGFAWAKRRMDNLSIRSSSRSSSLSLILGPSSTLYSKGNLKSRRNVNGVQTDTNGHYDEHDRSDDQDWSRLDHQDSMDDAYRSQELSLDLYQKKIGLVYQDQGDKVEFSGPLIMQSHRIDELLEKHERQIRQAVRRSWFQKVKKQVKLRQDDQNECSYHDAFLLQLKNK